MTVLLAGGGTPHDLKPILARFLGAARERAGGATPTIGLVTAGESATAHAALRDALVHCRVGFDLEVARSAFGVVAPPDAGELLQCDGILIAGDAPATLRAALEHRIVDLRRLVHDGVAYLGIGAGAALAGDLAWLGGNAIGGVAVAPGTETDELEFTDGFGLVDLVIVPGAAGAGRVGLAIAAIEAELCDRILAIDAGTAIEASAAGLAVVGSGSVWQLSGGPAGVTVQTIRDAE